MTQQVNLYQPIFREQRPPLSTRTIGQLVVLLALVLGGTYGYLFWQMQEQRSATRAVEARQAQVEQRAREVREKFPPPKKSQALQRKVDRLELELARKRRVLETLNESVKGRSEGFSGHLQAVARRHLGEMWLTEIWLDDGGRHVELGGSTYTAEQVPQFLQALADEEEYEGVRFTNVSMQRSEDDPRRLDFRLQTRAGTKK